jgi:plastocyanin
LFNSAAKLLFGLAVAALVLGLGLQVAIDEPAGFVLLMGIFAAAVLAGLALTGSELRDRAPRYGADAPPIETISVDARPEPPSVWPLAAAVSAGLVGVGLAAGRAVLTVGVVVAVLAAGGWLAQSWREDPSYTPREGAKVSDRLVLPFGLPALALLVVGIVVLSVSRVLLAVPKGASVAIAGSLAVALLATFFLLASRPHMATKVLVGLAGVAVLGLIAAGGVSAASGYRTFERHAPPPQGTVQVAQNTKYKVTHLTVTAGADTRITFANLDKGTYHNIAVYTKSPGGDPIWAGEPVKGVKSITYTHVFDLTPGTYSFRCDFHPTLMIGTFSVVAAR